MINLNYEFKLKPTKKQIDVIEETLEQCRHVWNYALRERMDWYAGRKCRVDACSIEKECIMTSSPNFISQSRELTQAKKRIPELKAVSSVALQQTLKTLDKAINDCFQLGNGFPKFKKYGRMKSFLFTGLPKQFLGYSRVKLPILGWTKIYQSRPYPEGFVPKQARIKKKASGYYVVIIFQSKENVPDPVSGQTSIGIDAGVKTFIATSKREKVQPIRFLLKQARKLCLLQRRLAKKKRRSKNWLKALKKVQRLHEKVANTRKDWLFKLAIHVCHQADNIFVEDINFKSWAKGLFGKKTLDTGIGRFINRILPYMAWKLGKFYMKVNKDLTSQTCPNCLKLTGKKSLDVRVHHCQHCGFEEDRDVAAAMIVEYRGNEAVGQPVIKNACEDGLTGAFEGNLLSLVKNL